MLYGPDFWFMAAFFLFIGLVGKRAWKFSTSQIDLRKALIENEIAESLRLRKEARALLDKMKTKDQEVEAHAEEILMHARVESERLQAEAAKEIEVFIKRREALASERIAHAENKAIKDIHARAIDVGIEAAGKIFQKSINPEKGSQLIDQAVEEIKKDLKWGKKAV